MRVISIVSRFDSIDLIVVSNMPTPPQRTVARALLPVLKAELKHLHVPEIIRRPRESDVRATCGKGAHTCVMTAFLTRFRHMHDLYLLEQLDVPPLWTRGVRRMLRAS